MIEFTNVSKKYPNGVTGIHKLNLSINKGEFVFVIGPSGAGKSSFLRLIGLQEKVTTGTLKINQLDVTNISRFKVHLQRRNIGVIFQDFKLLPKLTVYQNVAFALEAVGLPAKEVRKKAMKVIYQVGLGNKVISYPNQLSGGEQQRVAIARAIANNPEVVIADEPTGNLDPENSFQILSILKKLNEDGKTIIMATHNYDLIFDSDCRVIRIDSGEVVQDEVMGYHEI